MTAKLFDSVIIGYDGSKQADDALALGRSIGAVGGSAIVLAYITDHQPPFERQRWTYAQARRQEVHEVLEPALAALSDHEAPVEPASIDSSSPARGLHDLAAEYGKYGVIVLAIGSTHRGTVGRVVLGSVGEVLVSGAPCPILVAPQGFAQRPPASISTVAVGFDGSPESEEALRVASVLARATDATLRPVAVVHRSRLGRSDPGEAERGREELQARLDDALAKLGETPGGAVVDGDPAERLAEAGADADLLVLGARGYGPHQHVVVGSVSSKLMRTSPCPVLVLPRPGPDEASEGSG